MTGKPEENPKVSMPLKGRGVQITDKLNEMNERRERLEMVTYQQKMVGQQQSIKMLQEEERVVKEANQAAQLSEEIAIWQKEQQELLKSRKNQKYITTGTFDESAILEKKQRTEPLITKAYNAFRQTNTKQGEDMSFIPTEAYLDEQNSKDTFRDSTLSGLKHAQKLMVDTATVQTGDADMDGFGLPPIHDPKVSTMSQAMAQFGEPMTE